jgi:hypothetical protein
MKVIAIPKDTFTNSVYGGQGIVDSNHCTNVYHAVGMQHHSVNSVAEILYDLPCIASGTWL